ncbi:MAG: beta-propeller fold lactonase family protein [Planctomycetota bacterium]
MNRLRFAAIALAAVLAACGGGGGGGGGSQATAPQNLHYADDLWVYAQGAPINTITPTIDGSVDEFTVSPTLPPGITLDPATGAISGTPLVVAAPSGYRVRAANAAGASTFDLRIAVVAPARFAYALGGNDSTISIFATDFATGELQRRGYVVASHGMIGPEEMATHPNGRFAYVTNRVTNNVSIFEIDRTTGWLSTRGAIACGLGPHHIEIDAAGKFAYVSSQSSNQIHVYSIDATTGMLTLVGAPFATGVQPSGLAIDRNGRFLFVIWRGIPGPETDPGNFAGISAVQSYFIQPGTGTLSPSGAPKLLNGTRPIGISVDPVKDVIYVTLEVIDSIIPLQFDPISGALDYLPLDATGDMPSAVTVDPTGRFAYVANTLGDSLSVYTVDANTGNLSLVQTADTGEDPASVTVDPTGRHLYVVNAGSNDVLHYDIDWNQGTLTLAGTMRTRSGPTSLALATGPAPLLWSDLYVHVANAGSNDVSTFRSDTSTGALTEVGLAPLTGDQPVSVATDERHRRVFVANEGSGTLSRFVLDPSTGVLTEETPAVPIGGHPTHVAVDPSCRFVYVSTRDVLAPDDGWVVTLAIDATTNALTEVSRQVVGSRPSHVACDPTGQLLYCANAGTGAPGTSTISVFRVGVLNGIPQVSAPPQDAPGIFGLGFHPSGKYVYATLDNASLFVQYAIEPSTGNLTLVSGGSSAGLDPKGIALSPNGRFCFVSTHGQNVGNVSAFRVNAAGVPVPPVTMVTDGVLPLDLAIEPTGRFLYVANSGSNDVSVMSIDPVTGEPSMRTPVPTGFAPTSIAISAITQ